MNKLDYYKESYRLLKQLENSYNKSRWGICPFCNNYNASAHDENCLFDDFIKCIRCYEKYNKHINLLDSIVSENENEE